MKLYASIVQKKLEANIIYYFIVKSDFRISIYYNLHT